MTDVGASGGRRDWVGRTLKGRYLVESVLGAGGMGTVYLAHDRDMDRKVVVKVPHARLLDDVAFRERFTKEIRALTNLPHPHVVKVLDAGESRDMGLTGEVAAPFAVLEYLEGGSLRDRLAKGAQSPDEVLGWLDDVAKALDFVHSQGVVHRDVKPGNILFDRAGNAALADFGIVKALGGLDTGLTRTGITPGSPPYMGPEVGMGLSLEATYDQYALGVLVYESLSGALPHEGTAGEVLIARKAYLDPIDLLQKAPQIPAGVRDAVMRAIERDPANRYRSCTAFSRAYANSIPGKGKGSSSSSLPVSVTATPEPVRARTGTTTGQLIEIIEIRGGDGPPPPHVAELRSPPPSDVVEIVIHPEDRAQGARRIAAERATSAGLPRSEAVPSNELWDSTHMGPPGRERSPVTVLLLHLVTLGLYHPFWVFALFKEARAYADKRRDVRIAEPGPATAVYAITPLLILVLVFAMLELLRGGPDPISKETMIWGMVAASVVALPFAIAGWREIANLVTKMRIASGVGETAAGRTIRDALWMLVPVAGPVIFFWIVQSRHNRYWSLEAVRR